MQYTLKKNRVSTVNPAYMPKNELVVDRSGFVPTAVQVERIFKSSEIAAITRRLMNPNGSEDRIIEDLTQIELNYKDDLTMLAFAKKARSRLEAARSAATEQVAQADKVQSESPTPAPSDDAQPSTEG